jgi:hypothetical protein
MAPGVTFAARCIVAAAIGMTPIEEVQVPSLPDGAAGGAAQRDSFGFAVHRCHSRPGDRTAASISVHAALKHELALEEAAGDPRNSISPASPAERPIRSDSFGLDRRVPSRVARSLRQPMAGSCLPVITLEQLS